MLFVAVGTAFSTLRSLVVVLLLGGCLFHLCVDLSYLLANLLLIRCLVAVFFFFCHFQLPRSYNILETHLLSVADNFLLGS